MAAFLYFQNYFSKFSSVFSKLACANRTSGKREDRSPINQKRGNSLREGGDTVNTSFEKGKERQFDSFCKTVLRNEARDYYDEVLDDVTTWD